MNQFSRPFNQAPGVSAVGSINGLGAGIAAFLATPSSANLAAAVTDEVGSGLLPFQLRGNWTPDQGAGLVVVGAFSSSGRYVRTGNQVTVRGTVAGATSVAVASGLVITSNLPFANNGNFLGTAGNDALTISYGCVVSGVGSLFAMEAIAATPSISFTLTYEIP